MWVDLFLCLVLAHLVADFVLQNNKPAGVMVLGCG
jgi:hypothetical protein